MNNNQYKALFETMSMGVVYQNSKGVITDANPAAEEILGLSLDQLKGYTSADSIWRSIHDDGSPYPGETHPSMLALKTGNSISGKIMGIFNHTKKKYVWLKIDSVPLFEPGKSSPSDVYSTFEDISEQKLVEEKSRIWLENSPICTKILDLDFNLQYMSSAGIKDLRIEDISEFYGNPYPFHFYPDSFKIPMNKNLKIAKETGSIITQEASVLDIDGNELWYHSTIVPVKNEIGQLDYIMVVSLETTERKLAEKSLRDSEEKWRSYTENSPNHIMLLDTNYIITYINRTVPDLTIDQVIGKSNFDFVPKGYEQIALDCFKRVAKSGLNDNYETKYIPVDGDEHYFSVNISPLCDSDGVMTGYISTSMNITSRKKSDKTIAKQQYLLQKSQELGSIGTWELDLINNKLYWTDENCRIFGVKPGSVVNYEIFLDKVHPDDREYVNSEWLAGVKGKPYDIEHRLLIDGEVSWVREKAEITFDEHNNAISAIGFTQNVTAKRLATDTLWEAQKALAEAQKIAKIGSWELEPVTKKIIWSQELYNILEVDTNEEPTFELYYSRVHPDDLEYVKEVGSRVLESNEAARADYRLLTPSGEIKFITTTGHQVINKDSDVVKLRGVVQDITKRKEDELEKLKFEKQILQTQKLESLGILAGGIAHDFNNILMGILGYTDLALSEISSVSPAREYIEAVNDSSHKAVGLVKQMLAYSGKGKFSLQPVDLNEVIKETIQMLNVSISKNSVLRFNYSPAPVLLNGDPSQIRQIIMNLTINASEAIEKKSGVIAVTTGTIYCDREYIAGTGFEAQLTTEKQIPEGKYTFIEVSDTGIGMSKKTIARVFEPFFTTKFTGRGLGLSAIIGIVKGHSGLIKIYSEEGKGTTFKVLFPLIEDAVNINASDANENIVVDDWKGQGIFLIADDEEVVRSLGKHIIQKLGFEVLTADDGREAVNLFKKHPDEIVAVLLDLTMPHMDGTEVFHEIRRMNPEVKVILSSGYNEQDATQQFVGKGLAGFIQKPYVSAELINKIKEVLAND